MPRLIKTSVYGAGIAGFFAIVTTGTAAAHHGWAWTSGENTELSGTITEAELGNPHGQLTLDVDGESWTIEVGQPWRNNRAGLTDEDYTVGNEIRIVGEASSDESERRLKAERVYIGETEHALYPERD